LTSPNARVAYLPEFGESDSATFGQLADRVCTPVGRLREASHTGDRAVLLYRRSPA
jgi:hypothetical protein